MRKAKRQTKNELLELMIVAVVAISSSSIAAHVLMLTWNWAFPSLQISFFIALGFSLLVFSLIAKFFKSSK